MHLGPVAVGPPIGEDLRHVEHAVEVLAAAKVEEDVVESQAATHHAPGGHRGVEAAGEKRQYPALGAGRKATGSRSAVVEEPRFPAVQLDPHLDLGLLQVDAGGVIDQSAADLALHVG